jgi:early secretory antigenic target protein ESAT-6
MNNGVLAVNFMAMEQAKIDIQSAVTRLNADLQQLDADAAKLKGSWVGDAEQTYAAQRKRWVDAATSLAEILQGIQKALDHSTTEYLATEKKAAGLFQ